MKLTANTPYALKLNYNTVNPSPNAPLSLQGLNSNNRILRQDTVSFSGESSQAQSAREAAKAEAKAKNKSFVNWGKVGIKYTFKTAFQILKNCFSWQDVQNGASHVKQAIENVTSNMDQTWHKIPAYLHHGWEFAKEHILPHMAKAVHLVWEKIVPHISQVSFSGSATKSMQSNKITFQGDGSEANKTKTTPSANTATLSEPNELSPLEERSLQRKLMLAQSKFERAANKRYDTPEEREENISRYGTEVFNALYDTLSESQPGIENSVINDVHKMVNDFAAISEETTYKKNFAELSEQTQDQMIDLIQFALKHTEPLINETGQEMAQAIGLSIKTIDLLRQE